MIHLIVVRSSFVTNPTIGSCGLSHSHYRSVAYECRKFLSTVIPVEWGLNSKWLIQAIKAVSTEHQFQTKGNRQDRWCLPQPVKMEGLVVPTNRLHLFRCHSLALILLLQASPCTVLSIVITILAETDRGISLWQSVGRNKPCPCGSKRKYKSCCGTSRTRMTLAYMSRFASWL